MNLRLEKRIRIVNLLHHPDRAGQEPLESPEEGVGARCVADVALGAAELVDEVGFGSFDIDMAIKTTGHAVGRLRTS